METCSPILTGINESQKHMTCNHSMNIFYCNYSILVDSDGCLTTPLVSTIEYYQYRQVVIKIMTYKVKLIFFQFSLAMGVMTIVTGSFGIVGNFIRKVEHYN